MTIELRTISEEAAACRAAFAARPTARYAWHVHHRRLLEELSKAPERRIAYILAEKPEPERLLRLRLFRPVLDSEAMAPVRRVYNERLDAAWRAHNEVVAPAERVYEEAVATAKRAYDQAVATARRAYDQALAPARRAYDQALAPARRVYSEAVAEAVRIYDQAMAPAWRAYDEAVDAASRVYDQAMDAFHSMECPDCPWNGQSIFPEAGQ